MRILADADFLVALAKIDDTNHQEAVSKAKILKEALIFITPFTTPEATTVLSYKVSQNEAKRFLTHLRKTDLIEVFLDQKIISTTDKIFLSQNKKGTSWIDCLNVSVVRFYKLDGILSFDKFYKKLGIRMF